MPKRGADVVLLAITVLWGTTFTAIQVGLAHAGTFTFLALRFAIGALTLALIAPFRVLSWRSNLAGAGLGALSFIGFALQTGGLNWTSPSRSAFITGLTVVLVPIADAFLGRKQGRVLWVALGLALSGLVLLTRPGSAGGTRTLLGDLLTLGCTLGFGSALLVSERVAPRHAVFPLVFGHIVAMCLLSAATASALGWKLESCPSLWGSALFCGVVASAVCITAQMWAMKKTSATRASLVFALEPVFAALFAYLWRGDVLGASEVLGGVLIVLATLLEPMVQLSLPGWTRPRQA